MSIITLAISLWNVPLPQDWLGGCWSGQLKGKNTRLRGGHRSPPDGRGGRQECLKGRRTMRVWTLEQPEGIHYIPLVGFFIIKGYYNVEDDIVTRRGRAIAWKEKEEGGRWSRWFRYINHWISSSQISHPFHGSLMIPGSKGQNPYFVLAGSIILQSAQPIRCL